MALKYKESITGDALWPEVLATPTWHPAPGMPTKRLLIKVGDSFEPKTEIIGPGYRAAYGLVAIPHHQIMETNEKGEPQLMDLRIRTHGTPGYRSVKRGESNGCHRLHNYEALRLTAFLIKHHENVRDGLVPEDYVRKLDVQGPGSRAREREQRLPLQDDAAHPGERPRRRRQRRRQGRQAHGAAGRGSVARRRLVLFAHVTRAAHVARTATAEDAGLALARFVPIHRPMFSKGTTWPPRTSARLRVSARSSAPAVTDRQESGGSSTESAAVANDDSRTTESHWDSVIDRATD